MPKIVSYNVNGIRAALNKGLADWLQKYSPDIVCFQEIKANAEQFDTTVFEKLGYSHYWFSAEKKGYSGVGILSKEVPLNVEYGCGIPSFDHEGRIIRADFKDYSVISVYIPSGTTGEERQAFKMKWLTDFENYIAALRKKIPNLIICGDYNICHKAIDIHDPVRNATSSGFLPEERDWIDTFMKTGFIDSFRHFNQDPHQYSWWSLRANSRANNKGWRIDYSLVSQPLEKYLKGAAILPDVKHSDHCPVEVILDF